MSAIAAAVDPFLVRPEGRAGARQLRLLRQVYGGTFQHFSVRKMAERGIECRWVRHPWDMEDWKSKIDEDTRFLYMEMPSNPQQSFTDVKALADLAHSWGIPAIIDATCATPALLRPIAHGADIVVHSLTKSITAGGLAIAGPSSARKPITTKVKNDHPLFKGKLRRVRQVPALSGQRAGLLPVNALFALNGPADPALEDGRRQPELPEGRRVAPETPQGLPGRLSRPAELPPPRGR